MRYAVSSAALMTSLLLSSSGEAQRTPESELEQRCRQTANEEEYKGEYPEADDYQMRFASARRYPWPSDNTDDEEAPTDPAETRRFGGATMVGLSGEDVLIEGDILLGSEGGTAVRQELQNRYGDSVLKQPGQNAAAALGVDPSSVPAGFLGSARSLNPTARALLYSLRSELPTLERQTTSRSRDFAAGAADEAQTFVRELENAQPGTRRAVPIVLGRLWKKLPIPFDVSSMPDARKRQIREAAALWNKDTGLKLLEEATPGSNPGIRFVAGSGCSSFVGQRGDGAQPIKLGEGCGPGAIRHEIGHALGLFHEQSHPERDKFVEILWGNIKASSRYNFRIATNISKPSAYDYCSIMHYGPKAFGGGRQTIRPLQANAVIGQRQGPSPLDVQMIRALYNRPTQTPGGAS